MNIMRTIMLVWLVIALVMADSAVMGEEKTPEVVVSDVEDIEASPESLPTPVVVQKKVAKTTAELIAEVEASSQSPIQAPVSGENTLKTAAEIMAEIEALSKPTTPAADAADADDAVITEETASGTSEIIASATVDTDVVEELPLDDEPLPDEVIGEYAVEDVETAVASDSEIPVDEVASATLYEKADALEPSLMIAGTPADDEGDAMLSEKISGKILAEKKPLGRRQHLYRWVLKTDGGLRIPLKSNIKLLQEVRREKILDSQVSLTGKYIQSGYSGKLRYFVVESAVILDDVSSDPESDSKADAAAANKKK